MYNLLFYCLFENSEKETPKNKKKYTQKWDSFLYKYIFLYRQI